MRGVAGSFIVTAGWNWYHVKYRPHWRFVLISLVTWLLVYFLFLGGKKLFLFIIKKTEHGAFWRNEFALSVDKLFFASSLFFLMFFFRNELASLIYSSAILFLLFFVVDRQFSKHPNAVKWRVVNKGFFSVVFFLFLVSGILQYIGYSYYILDSQSKIYNIVVFRSVSITMFWMIGFALGGLIYLNGGKWRRYLGVAVWLLTYLLTLFVWLVNIGVLYFAGLYFSPVVLQHAGESGGSGLIWNWLTYILAFFYLVSFLFLFFITKRFLAAHNKAPAHYWRYYYYIVILIGIFAMGAFSSLQSTPEFVMAKSFYRYFFGKEEKINLPPYVFGKLERFGLKYNLDEFNVASKDKVFDKKQQLLPQKFKNTRPNIIIVYLESFSSRLVDVYNGNRFKNLTPGLDAMANDPRTTIFSKFYNASTPTITGIISQLCSFLPPTGHDELEREKRIKKIYLGCLPDILKKNGYKYTGYVTAVQKNFANKGTLFESMGTDEVYGTKELSKIIQGEPLAWGYSDHQMFPAMMSILQEKKKEPFLMMISTVDTHPPFNIAKDTVQFRNSRSNVLNSFHTTDDAFRIFWENFKNSEYYNDTIVIAIADHAIFPTAVTKDIFPEAAGKVTFYDENAFLMYVPDSILPKKIDTYSSGIDIAPSILHLLGINVSNSFEGHSVFDDRDKFPNLLGMHEFGLYINQVDNQGQRMVNYNIPGEIICRENDYNSATSSPLTLCEFLDFYKWKRQMFEEGRLWEKK